MVNDAINWILANKDGLLEAVIGTIALARTVTALTPSKADDDVVGKFERFVRWFLSLLAGANHDNLIDRSEKSGESAPTITVEQFADMLKKFDAKLSISQVPPQATLFKAVLPPEFNQAALTRPTKQGE